jgi:hypothetical protein
MRKLRIALTVLAILLPRLAAAQQYTIAPTPFQTALDNSGHIVSGACVWTYTAGTTTPATTYSDNAGTANSNPIKADSAGRFTAYLVAGTSYKFVYETSCTAPSHGTTLRTADNIAGVPAAAANVDVQTATAGETISAGQCAYLSDGSGGKNSGQWYKCDSANTYSSTLPEVGLALTAIASSAQGTIRLAGSVTGLSSLSVGSEYFVGTAGAITSTAPANRRHLGHADSATSLILTGDPPPFITTPISVANGGTALSTVPTNGQLLIGNGTGYTLATLTAGGGFGVTNGSGVITLTPNSRILDKVTTEQDVTATATETSVYSFSVPGGTLSTSNAIRLTLTGYAAVNAGADTLNIRVKFGGTTIAAGNMSMAASALGGTKLEAIISANNATNSQRSDVFLSQASVGATTDGTYDTSPGIRLTAANSSLAIDSTANQTLQVTVQWGSNSATNHYKRWLVMTELIQ